MGLARQNPETPRHQTAADGLGFILNTETGLNHFIKFSYNGVYRGYLGVFWLYWGYIII